MDKYIKYEDIRECRFFQDERGEWILHADIIKIPAADVVPVVRCGECKHYVPAEDDGEMMCVKDADWCVEDGCYYGFTESHDADWFCADGEREDGDGE